MHIHMLRIQHLAENDQKKLLDDIKLDTDTRVG